MNHPELQFIHRGQRVDLQNVPPDRTLLQVLREDLQACDSKEGCGEGDCGACTVVLASLNMSGTGVRYQAINACIRLAQSVHGMAVLTAQDLQQADGSLHPVQQALVDHHGSQCGFCTPGFVMSLYGLYQNEVLQDKPVTPETAQACLSGNLCRCTGYRPIVQAACELTNYPRVQHNETDLLTQLQRIPARNPQRDDSYWRPRSLEGLLHCRQLDPQAQLVAGCTDVGLWITKQHQRFERILDVTGVPALRDIEPHVSHLRIGAAVSLEDAWSVLTQQRPRLRDIWHRFAGRPVRQAGTLGGNIVNGSPIGDSMPVLMALKASLVLARLDSNGSITQRSVPLESFYTGYRSHVMASDEVLIAIDVPNPKPGEWVCAYKVSKRMEDDISAVTLALALERDAQQRVTRISIGVGGAAATPQRAHETELQLRGEIWDAQNIETAKQQLHTEFAPISDLRASAAYRTELLVNLLERAWRESQGLAAVTLEALT